MWVKLIPVIFVVLWSSGFVGARFGLQYAEPATLLALRMMANVAVFIVLIAFMRRRIPMGKDLLHASIVGLLIHGCYLGGTYQAISMGMPAGLCALLVGIQPILTAVLLVGFSNQRLIASQWLGLMVGFVGISLVLMGNVEWQNDEHQLAAICFTFTALVGITLGTLYQKKFCHNVDMIGGALVQYFASAILFSIVAWNTETMEVMWVPEFFAVMAWLVIVLSVFAILLLLFMVKSGESSKVASTFYLVPPVTAIQAWLVFNESFDWLGALGFTLAAIAVYLVVRKPIEKEKKISVAQNSQVKEG
ncbi:EamA/RhaT family transporter [Vibrionales bacterium C3R12]|nr:EamA/RhaT family transporter [Vibrionales bacterium C3R12]